MLKVTHTQCELVFDGASKEEKEAAAAQVRQAEGAVSEVESYLSDALVYAPVTGEVSTIIAEAGELVGTGYPVVAILDMSCALAARSVACIACRLARASSSFWAGTTPCS